MGGVESWLSGLGGGLPGGGVESGLVGLAPEGLGMASAWGILGCGLAVFVLFWFKGGGPCVLGCDELACEGIDLGACGIFCSAPH